MPTEREIEQNLEPLFRDAKDRMIVAIFSPNFPAQQVIRLGEIQPQSVDRRLSQNEH